MNARTSVLVALTDREHSRLELVKPGCSRLDRWIDMCHQGQLMVEDNCDTRLAYKMHAKAHSPVHVSSPPPN